MATFKKNDLLAFIFRVIKTPKKTQNPQKPPNLILPKPPAMLSN